MRWFNKKEAEKIKNKLGYIELIEFSLNNIGNRYSQKEFDDKLGRGLVNFAIKPSDAESQIALSLASHMFLGQEHLSYQFYDNNSNGVCDIDLLPIKIKLASQPKEDKYYANFRIQLFLNRKELAKKFEEVSIFLAKKLGESGKQNSYSIDMQNAFDQLTQHFKNIGAENVNVWIFEKDKTLFEQEETPYCVTFYKDSKSSFMSFSVSLFVIMNKESQESISKRSHTIEILGIKLSEENFPELYRWAKKSPDMVRESIQGMMDKQGFETPEGAMIILESDISHL